MIRQGGGAGGDRSIHLFYACVLTAEMLRRVLFLSLCPSLFLSFFRSPSISLSFSLTRSFFLIFFLSHSARTVLEKGRIVDSLVRCATIDILDSFSSPLLLTLSLSLFLFLSHTHSFSLSLSSNTCLS